MVGERADIGPALAQGGQVDLEGVEAEEEVFAEQLVGDHLAQVAIGRAENAHIDAERLVFTDLAGSHRIRGTARA